MLVILSRINHPGEPLPDRLGQDQTKDGHIRNMQEVYTVHVLVQKYIHGSITLESVWSRTFVFIHNLLIWEAFDLVESES